MKENIYFVTGIDTDAGKSYATGLIARRWNEEGYRTITQKLIQTGNTGYSEDIDLHRKLMGMDYTEEDRLGYTMPEIFTYPASPHLAARLDNRPIDFHKIAEATRILSNRYDRVLLEGAGGIMVPLTEDYLTIDYIQERNYPVIFVTSAKLGSINHTLLSLEALRNRNIRLEMVAYNLYPEQEDQTISQDTQRFIRKYLERHFPGAGFIEVPAIKKN
ncbi:dethiobiotin synthase [Parabacteroides sp. PF5-6]|uniref:dethiobiotin synthase n=1 Tax=Parabacteroides sp. PF5-6 TaxID=1742403 RepID=UPI0024055395|nr:dethiobiotin synthase [Parabacteroides sp. PF5-6]MDF9830967.1 dethiobiotin synthetase [Parabacteroides sp. PF5-6]